MDRVLFTFPFYTCRNRRQASFPRSALGVYLSWDKACAVDLNSPISACPLLHGCLMLARLLRDTWALKETFAVCSALCWHFILFPCHPRSHTTVMLASVHPEALISSQPPSQSPCHTPNPICLPSAHCVLPLEALSLVLLLLHTGVRSLLQLPRHQDQENN